MTTLSKSHPRRRHLRRYSLQLLTQGFQGNDLRSLLEGLPPRQAQQLLLCQR
ncbi:hypothetical protein [uncultured Thermosynechococcus sp.]|uniref:hypothetical protein n=1 Tax=uncultured Thermosynechococcus sp. TaxID=436945 RepID=UPI0026233B9E|nr:hypothetical protein [uncultured Thermosynechococcus sp.]